MMRAHVVPVAVVAILCIVVGGCKKDERSPAPIRPQGTQNAVPRTGTAEPGKTQAVASAAESLRLWDAGKQEEARTMLLAVNWADPAALARPPILQLTENEYGQAGVAERAKYEAEIDAVDKTFRALARAVMAAAKSEDVTNAEKHYRVLLEFCTWFSDDNAGVLRLGLVAKGFRRAVLTELVSVYSTLNERAKLEETKKELSQLQTRTTR